MKFTPPEFPIAGDQAWRYLNNCLPKNAKQERALARLIFKNSGVNSSALSSAIKTKSLPSLVQAANSHLYSVGLFICCEQPQHTDISQCSSELWRWFVVELPNAEHLRNAPIKKAVH